MLITNRENANNATVTLANRNISLFRAERMKEIVVTITHAAEIINMCGRNEGLNRLRKKTSRAVFPIMIAAIKQKK